MLTAEKAGWLTLVDRRVINSLLGERAGGEVNTVLHSINVDILLELTKSYPSQVSERLLGHIWEFMEGLPGRVSYLGERTVVLLELKVLWDVLKIAVLLHASAEPVLRKYRYALSKAAERRYAPNDDEDRQRRLEQYVGEEIIERYSIFWRTYYEIRLFILGGLVSLAGSVMSFAKYVSLSLGPGVPGQQTGVEYLFVGVAAACVAVVCFLLIFLRRHPAGEQSTEIREHW